MCAEANAVRLSLKSQNLQLDRRLLLWLATALVTATAPGWAAPAEQRAGAVEDVLGSAFAQSGAERRTLSTQTPIFIGDQVATETSSRLTARLGQSTTLRLGELARVRIDRFLANAGGVISLRAGAVFFDGPSEGARPQLQIRSPYGSIAVRGTRFFAGPSNGVFGVFVESGSVLVTGAGRSVTVRAGEGTDIARPGARPTPPKVWGPPRVRAALDSIR
jgi:ferric-dicitrate binding protein FerR (iron transport regulator)